MNKIYRLIWSQMKEMWMAVSEKVAAGWFGRPLTVGALVLAGLLATGGTARALDPNALPTGGQIVAGQGSIAQSGSTLRVNQQTDRMIAHWNSFNIGQNAAVSFQQPGASSVALNRILDQNPSQIFGSLSANGQVFLVNPAGVYFGPTARVDVGGLVASSLNLSNENFLNGNYRFEKTGGAGAITNQGQIRTADGGYIAFLSPRITNSGTLAAPGGTVALAAGDKVSLDFTGDKLVSFTVDQGAIDALIENQGLIKADGGLVRLTAQAAESLTALVVNNEGVIEANSLAEKNGRIILDGGDAGITRSSGAIFAKGDDPGEAGGSVTITGEKVGLFGAASVDVSGAAGGGAIHIGGGFQGRDGAIRNAAQTVLGIDASITADGGTSGNGGQVVLWSEDYTGFGGRISARGGAAAGDGGRVEVSSHGELNFQGAVDTRAANGTAGELLLDPTNIVVATADPGGGAVSRAAAADLNQFTDNAAETSWITPTNLVGLLNTAAVTMQAYNDITVADAVNALANTGNYGLTLTAGRSILINDDITLRGSFTAKANATGGSGVNRAAGAADFTMAAGKKIDTSSQNGAISITVSSQDTMGVATLSNLASGAGAISITADSMALIGAAEAIAGTGALTLKPLTMARPILLGAAGGAGDLALSTTELATLKETFQSITIGDASGNGGITFSNAFPLHASRILFRNTGIGGSVTFDGTASFNVTGAGVRSYFFTETFTQDPGATLASVSNIEITADTLALNGAANSLTAGLLALFPKTATRPVLFGAEGGAGVLSIDTTEMATMQNSSTIYVGDSALNPNGGITITGAIPLNNSTLVFNNTGVGGSITLNGTAAISTNNKVVQFYAGSGNAGAFTQAAGATVSTGSGSLTISADAIALNGAANSISGTSTATLTTKTASRPIVIGAAGGAGDFALDATELATLKNGFSTIKLGKISGTSTATISGPLSFNDPVEIYSNGVGGKIALDASAAINTNGNSLQLSAGTGDAGVFTQNAGATISAGAGALNIYGDVMTLNGAANSISGTGTLLLSPQTTSRSINIGADDAAGVLALNTTKLATLADGFSSITIGGSGTGISTLYGPLSFNDPVNIYNYGAGGRITLDTTAAINTNGNSIQIYAGTGDTGAFTQTNGATVTAGAGAITITADTITLNGAADSISGSSSISLYPSTVSRAMNVGANDAAGLFALNAAELLTLKDGFSSIEVGRSGATTGGLTLSAPLTFNDPLTLRLGTGGSFTVNATPTVAGALQFAGGRPAALNASVSASSDVSFSGAVTVGADGLTVDAGTGTATFSSTLAHGANNFTVTADDVALSANWTGSGTRTLQPTTTSQTIGLAGGAGAFALSATELGYLSNDAPASATIGRANGTGAIAGGAFSFNDPLILRGGAITQTGDWTLASTLSLQSGAGNDITLDRAGNDFTGAVSVVSGNNVSLRDVNALALGAATVSGNLTLQTGGAITQSGDLAVTGTTAITAGANDVILDRAGNDFGGAVSVVSGNNVSLRDANAMALGAATVSGNLTLQTGGTLTQSGNLAVTGTTAITAGANDVTLDRAGNDFGGAVSFVSARNITLNDSNALSLGAINATGTVDIATLTNDLTLTGGIDTTDATANAIKLNAGKSATAGTAAGGHLIVNGGTVTTGAGGRATLYTGGVAGSTGLTALAGSGSGRFRYNADETTDFSAGGWTALGTGSHAVYREQPTLTTTASDASKTYDGLAYSGGNGAVTAGFVNGDTSVILGGALAYGGTSQGAVNAGTYTITPGGYSNGRGYALAYVNGTLEIRARQEAPGTNPDNRSENIHAGITSPQNNTNGTGHNQGAGQGAPLIPALGPGAGSTTLGGLAATSLVTAPSPGMGSAVLSCDVFSTPVSVSASASSVTLALGNTGGLGAAVEVCALPVFAQRGAAPAALEGHFVLTETGSSLSLTRTLAGPQAHPAIDGMPGRSAPFTLNLESGMMLQLRVAVTAQGGLVVSGPDSAGSLDVRQAVLLGTQVAREALQVDPKTLTSAVFRAI